MNNSTPNKIEDNIVVTLNYTVSIDGEVVDTSEGHGPIKFIQGHGQVIFGLEREIYGLAAGEKKSFVVNATDGYGKVDPDAFAEIPRAEFSPDIPLEHGVQLLLKNQDGEEIEAYIYSIAEKTVRLSFNHPLAGKDLQFLVEVVSLRTPTEEELEHGHVHDGHRH